MRRILLVSYHFPPSRAMGAQRAERLARLLPEFGYSVDVICATVDGDAEGRDSGLAAPKDGSLSVKRVPTPFVLGRDPRSLPARRAFWPIFWWKLRARIEHLFLTEDWTWNWGQAACRAAASDIREDGIELMILDAPPNPSVVPLVRLARGYGIPIVIDLRDTWLARESPIPRWGWLYPSLRRSEWNRRLRTEAVLAADRVVLSSLPMKKFMQQEFSNLPPSTFAAITNAFGQVDGEPTSSGNGLANNPLKMSYTGSLAYGRDHQLANLIRGMAVSREQSGPHLELIVAGGGGKSLDWLEGVGSGSDGVRFVGWVSREEAIRLQRDSEVLLLLQPEDAAWDSIPGKLFEYMARRRNVLGLVGEGVTANLIREHDLGVAADGESPPAIARALAEIAERVRERPFLPPPPERFSERQTMSDFAHVLDGVFGARQG